VAEPRIAVAYSVNDPAARGSVEELVGLLAGDRVECSLAVDCWILDGGVRVAGFREDSVNLEHLDRSPDPQAEAVIVVSRHRAASGRKELTVHHVGNPTRRTLGGEPEKLGVSFPLLASSLLVEYRREAERQGILGEYEVSLEATHHGPTGVEKPVVFIEIGSTPSEWSDKRAQRVLASTLARHIERGVEPGCREAAAFGGSHYPLKFTSLVLRGEYCIGHIISKHAFNEGVAESVIIEAVEKTYPRRPGTVVVEKKSLRSAQRRMLSEIIGSLQGIEIVYV
jgi:D-aminoacyl-tRNA deacylase